VRGRLANLFRSRRFAAVDFDSRRLRIVQAERYGKYTRVTRLAGADIPGDIDLTDPEAVGRFLAETLKEMGLSRCAVVMNVPRSQAVLKPVKLPPGAAEGEQAGMVQYQVRHDLPFSAEEAVVDFTIESHYGAEPAEPSAPAGTDVLVAAVRLPVVDHYRQIALSAGVHLRRLGLRPYANMRCVDACTSRPAGESVAVVHITADETEIDVLAGAALAFSRAAVVRVPPPNAEAARIDTSVAAVVTEVRRSLQSLAAIAGARPVETVLVAGGTGIEPRVLDVLSRRLGVPCGMLDPTAAYRLREADGASAFISALGMATAGRAEEVPFDFLNPKRPPVQRDTTRTKRLAVAASAVVALLLVVLARHLYLQPKRSALAGLQKKHGDLAAEGKLVTALEQRVKAIADWDKGRRWLLHLANISSLFPPPQEAYVEDAGMKVTPEGTIVFTVRAKQSGTIKKLTGALVAAGYTLRPGKDERTEDDYGYIYQAQMHVTPSAKVKVDPARFSGGARPSDDASAETLAERGRRRS
jgi:Tfp pilus assembly PilM family ATPase